MDVDATLVEIFRRAAAGVSDDAHGVRVVHDEAGVVFPFQLQKLRQRRDIAVHGENAVGDDEPLAIAGRLRQFPREVLHVAMAVDDGPRFGNTAAIHDAGVVQRVGKDHVALVRQCIKDAQVRHVAGIENHRVLLVLESGDFFFQFR